MCWDLWCGYHGIIDPKCQRNILGNILAQITFFFSLWIDVILSDSWNKLQIRSGLTRRNIFKLKCPQNWFELGLWTSKLSSPHSVYSKNFNDPPRKRKNPKWLTRKTEFFKSTNSQYFFTKIYEIGPWVKTISWCQRHQCGLTYMVSGQFTAKKAFLVFLAVNWPYFGQ